MNQHHTPSAKTAVQDYTLMAVIMAILILATLYVVAHPVSGTALDQGNKIAPERLVKVPVSVTERSA